MRWLDTCYCPLDGVRFSEDYMATEHEAIIRITSVSAEGKTVVIDSDRLE